MRYLISGAGSEKICAIHLPRPGSGKGSKEFKVQGGAGEPKIVEVDEEYYEGLLSTIGFKVEKMDPENDVPVVKKERKGK